MRAPMLVAVAVTGLALSACFSVTPPVVERGRYSNHREMAYSMSQNMSWKGVPIELQRELRVCIIDVTYSLYTPDEIARLDRYARGEQQLTAEEFQRIDEAVTARAGDKEATIRLLNKICPDTMRKAEAHKAAISIAGTTKATSTSRPAVAVAPAKPQTATDRRVYCYDPALNYFYFQDDACFSSSRKVTEEQYQKGIRTFPETATTAAPQATPKQKETPTPRPAPALSAEPEVESEPDQEPTLRAALDAEPVMDISELTFEGSGSAFFVSSTGHLLTNEHVVKGCSIPAIALETGIHQVRILATDEVNDLALAAVRIKRKSYASFADHLPAPGDDTYAIGYPLFTEYWDIKVTKGIISGLSGPDGDRRLIQISAPVQPGNSGGPLVNTSGLVVGVIEGKRGGLVAENMMAEGIGFAVAPVIAATFLKENGVAPRVSESTKRREARDIVSDVSKWTVPFLCFSQKKSG
jgi:S1-C subfamily serine protease